MILPDGTRSDKFAQFHANKTRKYIDKTMASGEEIFSVMQACVLLSWYFYQEGRWVEVWIFAAFQTRVAIPLRLNYPGTCSTLNVGSSGAYLAPPKNLRDLESRRRAWWMTILFDRIASVGGWVHSIDERDIATELPLRAEDFESGVCVNVQNRPSILKLIFPGSDTKQFTRHLPSGPFYSTPTPVYRLLSAPPQSCDDVRPGHGFQCSRQSTSNLSPKQESEPVLPGWIQGIR